MKSETTSNELVIQGILKEVFFTETHVVFSNSNESKSFLISDMIESKIRDNSSNKQICFKGSNTDFFKPGEEYPFQARFHRYHIKGSCIFEFEKNQTLFFSFPTELVLENLRKADRAKVREELQIAVPVFLRSHSLHCEGSFVLEDTSAQGFGGTLTVPSDFPIEPGTVISGQLGLNESLGRLEGEIVSAVSKESEYSGYAAYRTGIVQVSQKAADFSVSEKRSQVRHKSKLQFTLESVLHLGQNLVLDVDDISVNGFSGVPIEGSLISSVPIGSNFKIESEKTTVRLVHFSNERLHFKILKRSSKDSINWIKKMTPYVQKGARCSSRDANELYRIFLQAGAVSAQYLKRHALHENLLVNQDGKRLAESACIHRWFVGGSTGEADAYVSAIRFGNSCWSLGDIAKVNGSEINAKDSVKQFFRSFSEFAVGDSSIGSLMIFWVKGHPMWESWHKNLQAEFKGLISSETKMNYFRVPSTVTQRDDSVRIRELQKESYTDRKQIINSLDPDTRSLLKNAFDFEESGTGSFVLAQVSDSFERSYLFVETQKSKYLAVISRSEYGISVNRFMDSLFLFPIGLTSAGDSFESDVLSIAREVSNQFGFAFPAVRVITDGTVDLPGTEMTCLLLYPRAFQTFE